MSLLKGGYPTDTSAENRRQSRFRLVDGGGRRRSREKEFEQYYRESFRSVYNFIYSRVLDRTVAEDVTSEAFIKAARAFDRYDPQRAQFSTWVITIARNVLISNIRKTGKEYTASDAAIDPDLQSTSDIYPSLETDDTQMLAELLSVVSEEDRELLRLKFYEGLQNKEIAEVLGINASTVGTKVQRAISKMKAAASERGY